MLKIFYERPLTIAVAKLENETGVPTLPSIINTIAKKSFGDIGDMVNTIADIKTIHIREEIFMLYMVLSQNFILVRP